MNVINNGQGKLFASIGYTDQIQMDIFIATKPVHRNRLLRLVCIAVTPYTYSGSVRFESHPGHWLSSVFPCRCHLVHPLDHKHPLFCHLPFYAI